MDKLPNTFTPKEARTWVDRNHRTGFRRRSSSAIPGAPGNPGILQEIIKRSLPNKGKGEQWDTLCILSTLAGEIIRNTGSTCDASIISYQLGVMAENSVDGAYNAQVAFFKVLRGPQPTKKPIAA
ncbi:hypothetical protein HQ403_03150 [Candidatus Kaiserbacteria bacterium]|nr:hypothetical protein [Candidatus Kaiserbacteria bacterium]